MERFMKPRGKIMSVKFDDFLQEQLQDPELKKEYDALQPERAIMTLLPDTLNPAAVITVFLKIRKLYRFSKNHSVALRILWLTEKILPSTKEE
jgi:hypothetical protein